MVSTASDSASITSTGSKWWPFSFILNRANRKEGWVGDDVVCGQTFPGEKGSVRRCVVVTQETVFFVAKVRSEVFAYFYAIAVKRHDNLWN
jgi:hypothetical protein